MAALEQCLRRRTALKPLEEALHIGADARAPPCLDDNRCTQKRTFLVRCLWIAQYLALTTLCRLHNVCWHQITTFLAPTIRCTVSTGPGAELRATPHQGQYASIAVAKAGA